MALMPSRLFHAALVGVLGIALTLLAAAPEDDDPFAPANAANAPKAAPADDPFGPANKAEPAKTPEPAMGDAGKLAAQPFGKPVTPADAIDLEAYVEPGRVRRGEIVTFTVKGTPHKGYHTYPVTQRTPNQGPQYLSTLTVKAPAGLQPLNPLRESEPEFVDTKVEGIFLEHEKSFTISQDVLVLPDAQPGARALRLALNVTVCDARRCLPPRTFEFEATVEVGDAPAAELTPALKQRLEAKPQIKLVPVPAGAKTETPAPTPSKPSVAANVAPPVKADGGLLGLLLSSMGAALLMVFTPCVFPMIPITVSFFVKQSEKEHHKPLMTAGVYSLTIIIVLALAVVLLGGLIIKLADDPWMNLALGAVLIYFSLSLFGMYDIELPSGLARFTSAREGQGGYAGAFFMALTFTITSFTCTGPFLGPLLATAATSKLSFFELLLAAFAYSTAFAAPFFLLALFPTLLKKLPKSGGWLNSVKVVMGFLELAAALKFLGNTDAAFKPGNPWFFTYDTVLCAWIALSVACGLYLLGVFRLPHDDPADHIGVIRMVLATIFFGLALHLMPALWRETPVSLLGEAMVAFLPRDSKVKSAGGGGATAQSHRIHLDYQSAWEEAVRDNKLLFIDFTGVNCTNCRDNELRVFPKPDVRAELDKYVRVELYTDTVPNPALSASQAQGQAAQNLDWQKNTFGEVSRPHYVVFKPDKKTAVADGKLKGVALGQMAGKIFDSEIPDFIAMLRKPLNGQPSMAQAKAE